MELQNILLIGSGGREHALAESISKSPNTCKLFIAPGNPGTAQFGTNIDLDTEDFEAILHFIEQEAITLTVVGPEKPLVDGLVDYLEDEGKFVFGPSAGAARLEGSKSFAKDIMHKYGIPTAGYVCFERHEWTKAVEHIEETQLWPRVIKADGLAAGKGVFVCDNKQQALEALEMLQEDPNLSTASYRIVIEEFLKGEEVSVFAISDGNTSKILFHAQDHKRIGDGDTGLNTGGMGAYGPAPLVNELLLTEIDETVIRPTVDAMVAEGSPFKGIIYAGLMITDEGPKVVEYNCRFGDPECQVILPALKTDLVELMLACVHQKLDYVTLEIDPSYYTCVVVASKGYPSAYEKNKPITINLPQTEDVFVYQAGTKRTEEGTLVSNGGRVLNVVAKGESLHESIDKAYKALNDIHFEGMYFRRDIGAKGLRRL